VRRLFARSAHRLLAVRGERDDAHVGLALDHAAQALAHDLMVVGDQYANPRHRRTLGGQRSWPAARGHASARRDARVMQNTTRSGVRVYNLRRAREVS
jgi:hypothetical protein